MKVAYNSCFGGFSLSPIAETAYQEKKNVNLVWYKTDGFREPFTRTEEVPAPELFRIRAATKDLGKNIESIPEEFYHYESFGDDAIRCDPDLIEVIERFGDKASGPCAKLAIKKIPDGAEFEITEYDGLEDVVPPRQSWGD